jgi:hypothetical protein
MSNDYDDGYGDEYDDDDEEILPWKSYEKEDDECTGFWGEQSPDHRSQFIFHVPLTYVNDEKAVLCLFGCDSGFVEANQYGFKDFSNWHNKSLNGRLVTIRTKFQDEGKVSTYPGERVTFHFKGRILGRKVYEHFEDMAGKFFDEYTAQHVTEYSVNEDLPETLFYKIGMIDYFKNQESDIGIEQIEHELDFLLAPRFGSELHNLLGCLRAGADRNDKTVVSLVGLIDAKFLDDADRVRSYEHELGELRAKLFGKWDLPIVVDHNAL